MSTSASATSQAFNAGVRIDYTQFWECPACPQQHVTNMPQVHTPLHQCSGTKGAWVPYVERGTKASFRINRREDYVGTDTVAVDGNGEPVMSITTLREDGEDCTVFAPSINARISVE